jgi:ribokinase
VTRVGVVGHVEWVEFARVDHVPTPGEIEHATETWELPAGGGPGAAVQMAKLAGEPCLFLTALGDDELGHRAERELTGLGLEVEAVFRPLAQRRAFTFVDAQGERTITVIGERMGPHRDDPLPWDRLGECDSVYFTAGDRGALQAARSARVLVATSRVFRLLAEAGVELDALVRSSRDVGETFVEGALDPPPRLVVSTAGREGGTYEGREGRTGRWAAAPVPGPVVDAYGAGDSFAGALTFALGTGMDVDAALALAARCGAASLTGRGPYEGQLTKADVDAGPARATS